MWTLNTLIELTQQNKVEIKGRYVPVRPLRMDGLPGLYLRIKDAWAVLTDKADAFKWPGDQ